MGVWADLRVLGSGPKHPGSLLPSLSNTVRSPGSPACAGKPGASPGTLDTGGCPRSPRQPLV